MHLPLPIPQPKQNIQEGLKSLYPRIDLRHRNQALLISGKPAINGGGKAGQQEIGWLR
jgi:hypothetical protein